MLRTSQIFNLIKEGQLKRNRIHKKLNNDKHAIQRNRDPNVPTEHSDVGYVELTVYHDSL